MFFGLLFFFVFCFFLFCFSFLFSSSHTLLCYVSNVAKKNKESKS